MAYPLPRRDMPPNPSTDSGYRLHGFVREALSSLSSRLPLDRTPLSLGSSSSDSDFSIRPRRPAHSRSMSHPFPSLFSTRRKHHADPTSHPLAGAGQDSGIIGPLDSDSTDDGAGPHPHSTPSQRRSGDKKTGPTEGHATGNCMTCGSVVRWPLLLSVFKCSVCQTVNDIIPRLLDPSFSIDPTVGAPILTSRRNGSPSGQSRSRAISVEYAKLLARRCMRKFLSDQLGALSGPTVPIESTAAGPDGLRTLANEVDRKSIVPDYSKPLKRVSGPGYLFDIEPTLRPPKTLPLTSRSYSLSQHERPYLGHSDTKASNMRNSDSLDRDEESVLARTIFKPLEEYILSKFASLDCVNSSFFPPRRPSMPDRPVSETLKRRPLPTKREASHSDTPVCELDPKLLLLGDFAENGSWWSGGGQVHDRHPTKLVSHKTQDRQSLVSTRSPYVDWAELHEWFSVINNVAQPWKQVYDGILAENSIAPATDGLLQELELQLLRAQEHIQRLLLKSSEILLKRPGRPIQSPEELRFLLVVLENPLLQPTPSCFKGYLQTKPFFSARGHEAKTRDPSSYLTGPLGAQHSGIIKRAFGIMSNSNTDCQNYLVTWFSKLHISRFTRLKELAANFLTYRLLHNSEKRQEAQVDFTASLVPSVSLRGSPASLQAALTNPTAKIVGQKGRNPSYENDWQIKAMAKVMALLFLANNSEHHRRGDGSSLPPAGDTNQRDCIYVHGQLLPTSDFYNTQLDLADLVADFGSWESKGKFSFCQYPFLLSIWAKSQILEFEARRQMQTMARDAFFDSIMTRKNFNQFLMLNVRRDCLVEDSLTAVSEIIGSGSEDIKKGLRITFRGEEGIDAGGLRKEWFLLLVRELFGPDHGMFTYDDDSQYCYFNPNSFETSDQFFLVGVVMGLAIYNSTILDVPLPPFAFRKLLAAAPTPTVSSHAHARPTMTYSLDDLGEYRPSLATGLRTLLEYEGDVETALSLDFTLHMDKYGTVVQVPLCPGGDTRPVTNANRREYVDLYVRYLLDLSVTRQFEPFKRGFYTVCGGTALTLFRPEEIELLIRGSDEALDVGSLRAVAQYDNWGSPRPDESEPTVAWFWDTFLAATPADRRKLLLFITGSDRIPATGAALLPIKISCLGDDCGRYPIARTCFNTIALWRYASRQRLEEMLWTAVHWSEGFGLR